MDDVSLPFRPGTISYGVLRRPVFLLGGMRALLMQIAEARVAAGVARHSNFTDRPFDRMQHTIELITRMGLGERPDADEALQEMDRAHEGILGTMEDGSRYDASDPELRLWVLATLIETVLVVEETYVGEFDEHDRRRYYRESLEVAHALGIEDAPPDLEAFHSYMQRRIESTEVSDEARRIAAEVLHPRTAHLPRAVLAPLRLVTIEMLPAPLRIAYDLPLTSRQERWLRRFRSVSRATLPRLPDRVRTFPIFEVIKA